MFVVQVALLLSAVSVVSVVSSSSSSSSSSSPPDCRLYLGPSQLSSEDKVVLGVYAGVDYDVNDIIPNIELGIPLVDFTDVVDKGHRTDEEDEMHKMIASFVESQVWTADYGGAKWEGNHTTVLAIPGMGSLANYHSGIYNVDWLQGSTLLRSSDGYIPGLNGGEPHMARGSITSYYNFTMQATTKILAGMELFANFGDTWDNTTADFNAFQDKLTRWDYIHADQVLDSILAFMKQYEEQFNATGMDLQEDVLDFMLNQILGKAAGKQAKAIKSLIPDNVRKLQKVQDMGGTFNYRNQDMVRDKKWLRRNAICIDNVEVKPSTIPEAGRGAFATRPLDEKKVITRSPMMHVTDQSIFNMYSLHRQKGYDEEGEPILEYRHDYTKPIGKQMLVNYCFFHPESSLLLWPEGPHVNYINHAPNTPPSPDYEGPLANAFTTWSQRYNDHSVGDFFLEDLAERDHPAVVMDVVAMKDIQPGEEIFIDYGSHWQTAFNAYQKSYQERYVEAKSTHNWRLLASDLIKQYQNIPFPYNIKRSSNPYPWNVATACFLATKEREDGVPMINRQKKNIEILQFSNPNTFEEYNGLEMYVCDIMNRTKLENKEDPGSMNNYRYTVIAKLDDGILEEVVNVPHSAITLIDRPYTSDMHVPGAFRHPIGIRDQDFPQPWRNLRG